MPQTLALHSRYNPSGEAERYLDSLALEKSIGFFILIEPGMGYLSSCLRKKNPDSKIIALHAKALPEFIPEENRPDASWFPGAEMSLRKFLEQEIPEIPAQAVKVIEWRPALTIFREAYCFLLSETVEFIKQNDASARTVKQFGQRWFRNFFKNLALLSNLIYPESFTFPIVITGAGPSLEDAIPLIRRERQDLLLMAVSSSVTAIKEGGLEPDIIVATDGGNWALLHLNECFRGQGTETLCLAVSLSAALPSQCNNAKLLLMSDGSLWQELILSKLGIPFITLPQRGTVSAAALDLAFVMTNNMVFLSGLDLSNKGIQTHARPYSFDRIWEEKSRRFSPVYSQVFARSSLIRDGGSHNIYASWFSRQLTAYPKRLRSLGANNPVFRDLETSSINNHALKGGVLNSSARIKISESEIQKPVWKIHTIGNNGISVKEAALFLGAALNDPRYGAKLTEELGPVIGLSPQINPGKDKPNPDELGDSILSLTKAFWGLNG